MSISSTSQSPTRPVPRPVGAVSHEPSLVAKMYAAVCARRLDRKADAGVLVRPASMLAAHTARLTSRRERTELASVLRAMLDQPGSQRPILSARVPVDRENIAEGRSLILTIIERLESRAPVRPRGVARLRLLIGDGAGPLYTSLRGRLPAPLRGVLAAL